MAHRGLCALLPVGSVFVRATDIPHEIRNWPKLTRNGHPGAVQRMPALSQTRTSFSIWIVLEVSCCFVPGYHYSDWHTGLT